MTLKEKNKKEEQETRNKEFLKRVKPGERVFTDEKGDYWCFNKSLIDEPNQATIEVNELRVGSWYESTKWRMPVVCTIEDMYEIVGRAEGAVVDKDHIATVFKPITITEKILVDNLGFKEAYGAYHIRPWDDNTQLALVKCHYKGMADEAEFDYWIINKDGKHFIDWFTPLAYIHELMTLIYSLTGKELIWKQ